MNHLASAIAIAGLIALPAAADIHVSYTCDLHGLDGVLDLDISGDPDNTADGHPSSLVSASGPPLVFTGELTSEMAGYSVSGRGQAGALSDLASDETYEAAFSADGGNLLVTISPDTPGQVIYRCRKS